MEVRRRSLQHGTSEALHTTDTARLMDWRLSDTLDASKDMIKRSPEYFASRLIINQRHYSLGKLIS